MRNIIFRNGAGKIVAATSTGHDEQDRVRGLAYYNLAQFGSFEKFGEPGDKIEITDGMPVGIEGGPKDGLSNFEKITASPEALAAFLASLPTLSGPWDDSFHREFCDDCPAENCDAENCPHNAERDNPLWWLGLTAEADA